jgi:short-subunit dehydrogenase
MQDNKVNMTAKRRQTALITGASSGIGAEFARQLAAQGYDLILVARRAGRMEELAQQLAESGREIEIVTADLTDPEDVRRVEGRIATCETLEMLVNNAGFGTVGDFAQVEIDKHADMVEVHVLASTRLVRAALPGMLARRHGAIINVASVAAFTPLTGNVVYSASKAYLTTFCTALSEELIGTEVRVQALCPGFTTTDFHYTPEFQNVDMHQAIPKFLWMTTGQVVSASLRSLRSGRVFCIPGFYNNWVVFFGRLGIIPLLGRLTGIRMKEKKSLERGGE